MDKQISRTLANGLAEGRGPMEIARSLVDRVEKIGVTRARMLARTETIASHAQASLNTYEEAGLEGVQVEAEFATAQDNKVCPECQALEGRTFTMQEAQGVIPVHPNCRCAWLPVVANPREVNLR
jgi:SPP1 gp7 family putative phage head morphogenesis protein